MRRLNTPSRLRSRTQRIRHVQVSGLLGPVRIVRIEKAVKYVLKGFETPCRMYSTHGIPPAMAPVGSVSDSKPRLVRHWLETRQRDPQ